MGINGQLLGRNSPGIANMALMGAHFGEGRELNLNQVGLHPIQNSAEMGQSLPKLITELDAIPEYQQSFQAIWPDDGVTDAHIGEALAAYIRTLMELRMIGTSIVKRPSRKKKMRA